MTPVQIMDTIRKALKTDERPQKVIAEAAGIHPVNLSQFKAGNRDMELGTLCTLAKVLGLEIVVRDIEKKHSRRS